MAKNKINSDLQKALKRFPLIVAEKKKQAKMRKKISDRFDKFSKKIDKTIKPLDASSKSMEEIHPWRPCPLGQHWVITHRNSVKPSKENPQGGTAIQSGHCRKNPSKKDHLYKDDIIEISQRYFSDLQGSPSSNDLGFGSDNNIYDSLIRGWTQYWNDVLKPKDPLDADLVKALIASESGFKKDAWNGIKGGGGAHGLMQVLNKSVPLLGDAKELNDHFVNLTKDDMKDPNLSICAGIRWLFRKKQIVESRRGNSVAWRDVVAYYKGIEPTDKKLMPRFDKFFKTLKGAEK